MELTALTSESPTDGCAQAASTDRDVPPGDSRGGDLAAHSLPRLSVSWSRHVVIMGTGRRAEMGEESRGAGVPAGRAVLKTSP